MRGGRGEVDLSPCALSIWGQCYLGAFFSNAKFEDKNYLEEENCLVITYSFME